MYLGHNVRKADQPAEFFYGGPNGMKTIPAMGDACAGGHPLLSGDPNDEYDHIVEGAVVDLVNSSGKVVATSELGSGTIESAPGAGTGCVFKFSLPAVAGDSTSLKAKVHGYDLTVPVTSANTNDVRLDFP